MAMFVKNSKVDPHFWALDVPVSFAPPLLGKDLTVIFGTDYPETIIAAGDVVYCFANGRLVMLLEVDEMASLPSLQVTLGPNEDPSKRRSQVCAILTHVAVREVRSLYESGQDALTEQVGIAVAKCFGDKDNAFSAACEFDQTTGKALYAAILKSAPEFGVSTKEYLDGWELLPSFISKDSGEFPVWAVSVPHNFGPPPGHWVTVLAAMPYSSTPIVMDDLVLFFSRGRLVAAGRAIASNTPPDLQMSIEIKKDPEFKRLYFTSVQIVLEAYFPEALHYCEDLELRQAVQAEVCRQFPNHGDILVGDARPFSLPMVDRLKKVLELTT